MTPPDRATLIAWVKDEVSRRRREIQARQDHADAANQSVIVALTVEADHFDAIAALLEADGKLREPAQALADVLVKATPALNAVCQMSQIHGCPYTGPTYGVQLEALQAALAQLPAPPVTEAR